MNSAEEKDEEAALEAAAVKAEPRPSARRSSILRANLLESKSAELDERHRVLLADMMAGENVRSQDAQASQGVNLRGESALALLIAAIRRPDRDGGADGATGSAAETSGEARRATGADDAAAGHVRGAARAARGAAGAAPDGPVRARKEGR